MKRLEHLPRWFLLALWAMVVILLTTLPESTPVVSTIAKLLNDNSVYEAIAHACLFGSLTPVVYWALRLRLRFDYAFWLAIGLVLALGTGTELAQRLMGDRTATLSDLLANFVGVLTVATFIGYRSRTLV